MGNQTAYICKKCGYEFWNREASAYRKFKKRKLEFKQISENGYFEICHCPHCDERDNFDRSSISVFYGDPPSDDDYYWWKERS